MKLFSNILTQLYLYTNWKWIDKKQRLLENKINNNYQWTDEDDTEIDGAASGCMDHLHAVK